MNPKLIIMKKVIVLFLSVSLLMSFSAKAPTAKRAFISKVTYVYICDSKGATKYHYRKNCRGLSSCKHDIVKVTLDQAVKKGKKSLCGWED